MSLLTTSIESTHLTRWNVGLVALTLLGVSWRWKNGRVAVGSGPPALATVPLEIDDVVSGSPRFSPLRCAG